MKTPSASPSKSKWNKNNAALPPPSDCGHLTQFDTIFLLHGTFSQRVSLLQGRNIDSSETWSLL
jgi:hypothetical protein